MKAVVWSKPNCPYCVMAKKMLDVKGYQVEERIVGNGWTREQLTEAVPNVRSVPQIFVDDEYIGGYDNLVKFFESKIANTAVQMQWETISFPHD
jgi:glutaredoxin 3